MNQPFFKTLDNMSKRVPTIVPTTTTNTGIPMFLSKIFTFRDKLHFAHLATNSYAEHKALNDAYEDLLELADTLVESIQGIYGIQPLKQEMCEDHASNVAMVQYMYDCINENRPLFKESWIQNQLDEICALFAQTLYKLKNLK